MQKTSLIPKHLFTYTSSCFSIIVMIKLLTTKTIISVQTVLEYMHCCYEYRLRQVYMDTFAHIDARSVTRCQTKGQIVYSTHPKKLYYSLNSRS